MFREKCKKVKIESKKGKLREREKRREGLISFSSSVIMGNKRVEGADRILLF